jgi:hypothetical protein
MPKISKATAPNVADFGPAIDSGGDLDDYTFDFVSIRQTHSLEPMLKGLPQDRCPCPHWGYLFTGKIIVTYADHEEVYEPGDAFYMAPGHVPAAEAGSEFLQISPKDQLAEVVAVIAANVQRMTPGT